MKNTMRRKEGLLNKIVKGIYTISKGKTFKNKMFAILLVLIGCLTIKIGDGDCTVFILILFMALPLFFTKENYIV